MLKAIAVTVLLLGVLGCAGIRERFRRWDSAFDNPADEHWPCREACVQALGGRRGDPKDPPHYELAKDGLCNCSRPCTEEDPCGRFSHTSDWARIPPMPRAPAWLYTETGKPEGVDGGSGQ